MTTSSKKISKGLGDRVASLTKATRIDKLAKKVLGPDCGCDKRQAELNAMFPNFDVVQMDAEQRKQWEQVVEPAVHRNRFTPDDKRVMSALYADLFGIKWEPCNCSGSIRRIYARLKKVYLHSCHDETSI